jgi:hypothetical protein
MCDLCELRDVWNQYVDWLATVKAEAEAEERSKAAAARETFRARHGDDALRNLGNLGRTSS